MIVQGNGLVKTLEKNEHIILEVCGMSIPGDLQL